LQLWQHLFCYDPKTSTQAQSNRSDDRYTRGIETLKRVGGKEYDRSIRLLESFSQI
jgi:hypothetical protein